MSGQRFRTRIVQTRQLDENLGFPIEGRIAWLVRGGGGQRLKRLCQRNFRGFGFFLRFSYVCVCVCVCVTISSLAFEERKKSNWLFNRVLSYQAQEQFTWTKRALLGAVLKEKRRDAKQMANLIPSPILLLYCPPFLCLLDKTQWKGPGIEPP